MKWERRNQSNKTGPEAKPSDLPLDYLKLVEETLTQALEDGLAAIKKIHPETHFKANGAIYADEVLLVITLAHGAQQIAATTVYSSANYNPTQEKPALMDVLAACLDSAGSVFQFYLDPNAPEKISQILDHSLGALEEAPFEWSLLEPDAKSKIAVYVKIDKSNPALDAMADEWLKKHDPDFKSHEDKKTFKDAAEAEEFLDERLQAIKNAKSGTGSNSGNGPITH